MLFINQKYKPVVTKPVIEPDYNTSIVPRGLTQIRRAQLLWRAVPWRAPPRQTPQRQALPGQGSDRQERAKLPHSPRNFEEVQRQFLCEIKKVCWCVSRISTLNSYVHLLHTSYRDCFAVVVCRATASAVERWPPAEILPISLVNAVAAPNDTDALDGMV